MISLYKIVSAYDFSALNTLFDGARPRLGLEGGNGDIGKHTLWDLVIRAREFQAGFDLAVAGTVPIDQFVLSLQGRLEKVIETGPTGEQVKKYIALDAPHEWGPAQKRMYIATADIQVLKKDGQTYVVIDAGKKSQVTFVYRQLKGAERERVQFFDSFPVDVVITATGMKKNEEGNSFLSLSSTQWPLLITGPIDATSRTSSAASMSASGNGSPTVKSPAPLLREPRFSFTTARTADPTGTMIKAVSQLHSIPASVAPRAELRMEAALITFGRHPQLAQFVVLDPALNTAKSVSGVGQLSVIAKAPSMSFFTPDGQPGKRARMEPDQDLVCGDLSVTTFFDNQFAYAANAVVETALGLAAAYQSLEKPAQVNLALPAIVSIAGLLGAEFEEAIKDGHRLFSSSSCTSNSNLVRMLATWASVYVALRPEIDPSEVHTTPMVTIRKWAATAYTLHHRSTDITAIHASTHSDLGNDDADTLRLQSKISGSETQVKRVWAEFVECYADQAEVERLQAAQVDP